MLWYHDHSVHITRPHVYRGLAGFYILKDEIEDALRLLGVLPREVGCAVDGWPVADLGVGPGRVVVRQPVWQRGRSGGA
jgi:hypothetical protein